MRPTTLTAATALEPSWGLSGSGEPDGPRLLRRAGLFTQLSDTFQLERGLMSTEPWNADSRRTASTGDQLQLDGISPTPARTNYGEQLSLLGEPTPIRVPSLLWRSWLEDPSVVARFEAKRYRRGDRQCWPWLNAVSSTGHGSFRAASLPGASRRGTVPAHLFAFQLVNGVIPRLGWSGTEDPVLCHRCDSHGCTNPSHLSLGTNAQNRTEWAQRHRDPGGPLADVRGAAGRTRAIAAAVRTGLALGETPNQIDQRIRQAELAGQPLTLW